MTTQTRIAGEVAAGHYQCHWCKQQSPREAWGPGWVRCPHCKQIAPSAAEVATMERVAATSEVGMTYPRRKAHDAQNRWLNGKGGHAEALEAVEVTVNEVIDDTTLDLIAVVEVALRNGTDPLARLREMWSQRKENRRWARHVELPDMPPSVGATTVGAHTLRKEVRDIIAGHGAGYTHDIDARANEVLESFEAWLKRRQGR